MYTGVKKYWRIEIHTGEQYTAEKTKINFADWRVPVEARYREKFPACCFVSFRHLGSTRTEYHSEPPDTFHFFLLA